MASYNNSDTESGHQVIRLKDLTKRFSVKLKLKAAWSRFMLCVSLK